MLLGVCVPRSCYLLLLLPELSLLLMLLGVCVPHGCVVGVVLCRGAGTWGTVIRCVGAWQRWAAHGVGLWATLRDMVRCIGDRRIMLLLCAVEVCHSVLHQCRTIMPEVCQRDNQGRDSKIA